MKTRYRWLAVAAAGLIAGTANASLSSFQSFVGNYGLSSDGFGSTGQTGTLTANIPAGSTVVAAYLYTATFFTGGAQSATLEGTPVTYGPGVFNGTACCTLASFRADVTSIVQAKYDGNGGAYDFSYAEGNTDMDGSALVVVYRNASLPVSTVGILDGWASVTGDTTSINFADPLNPSTAGFFAEMRLGIGFSCCGQESTVDVNGQVLSQHAGNNDDGIGSISNGQLITVGGDNDPFSPTNPSYADDHERYNLVPFITLGDKTIKIDTANASQDDNIFLALFHVFGRAGINEPPPPTEVPEPGTLWLLGLGMIGLGLGRRRLGARVH